MTQPKTGAELLALPIGGEFGQELREIDGRVYRVPTAPQMSAFFHEDDTVIVARDADGQAWRLGCQDGKFCRVRTVF